MQKRGKMTITTRSIDMGRHGEDMGRPGETAFGVEIEVTDSGCGMSEEVQSRAFDPFFTTKPIGQGSGLGLSQVYSFVQQSGGTIQLDSKPELGTRIHIQLPVTAKA
jgi:signal transduction histidine kinase